MNTDNKSATPLTPAGARDLLARFEAGETSVAEERDLFSFFRSPALPPDLEPLRPLMAWYEGGCRGEPEITAHHEPARIFRWRPLLRMAAAVATIIAVAASALLLPNGAPADEADDFATIYAGSYIIRDGQKITDPALIRDEILSLNARLDSARTLIAAASSDPKARLVKAIEERYASSPLALRAALSVID